MEDGRWLRFLTIGLVLTALVVGYFIVTGRFSARQENVVEEQQQTEVAQTENAEEEVLGEDAQVSQASPTPKSAYDAIAQRSKGGVEELPKTGFPLYLWSVISVSALIAGWGLRKFPN
ncbi:MAG: hypothetical protein Q8P92_01195 [Candidatus Daviesbacteria bacterium]|nr:hypothetical protein [Candidatus Daviesbacteria bacterium]